MLRPGLKVGINVAASRYVASVAMTAAEQQLGLQEHDPLAAQEALWFPSRERRRLSFHMGRVAFPIDIGFVDGDRIARVVRAMPGSRETWSHVGTGVLETAQGRLQEGARVAQQTYNLLRTITEAAPLSDGYYTMKPESLPHPRSTPPKAPNRWQDRMLPDQAFSEAQENPLPAMPVSPVDGYAFPVWPVRAQLDISLDVADFAVAMLEAAFRGGGVAWAPVALNQQLKRAVVSPEIIGRWLRSMNLSDGDFATAYAAATTPEGMDTIGQAFIAADLADIARLVRVGPNTWLELIARKT